MFRPGLALCALLILPSCATGPAPYGGQANNTRGAFASPGSVSPTVDVPTPARLGDTVVEATGEPASDGSAAPEEDVTDTASTRATRDPEYDEIYDGGAIDVSGEIGFPDDDCSRKLCGETRELDPGIAERALDTNRAPRVEDLPGLDRALDLDRVRSRGGLEQGFDRPRVSR